MGIVEDNGNNDGSANNNCTLLVLPSRNSNNNGHMLLASIFLANSGKASAICLMFTCLIPLAIVPYLLLSSKFSSDPTICQLPCSQAAVNILEAIIAEPFTNDSKQFEEGSIHFFGTQLRLDYAFIKLLFSPVNAKRKLNIAAIGGSITAGNGIQINSTYAHHFVNWLSGPLQQIGIEVTFTNAAIGATGSEYFSMCISEYLNLTEVDILLVEFAFGDGRFVFYLSENPSDGGRPLEELVRSVWRQNPMIHIVLVNFPFFKNIFRLYYPPKCESIEDEIYLNVAQRYQLTSIRWKHMYCKSADNSNVTKMTHLEQKQLAEIYISDDGHHPSSLVHIQMAEFLIHYFRTSLSSLSRRLHSACDSSADLLEKMSIIEKQTFTLMRTMTPLHPTAWIDGADCFVSFDRPFKKSSRLSKALTNASSDFEPDYVYTINFYQNGSEEFGDNLQMFYLQKSSSFLTFRLKNFSTVPACQGAGFQPHLAIVYTTCKDCWPGAVRLTATLVFTDGAILHANYTLKLKPFDFKINYVHNLPPLSTTTTSTVSHKLGTKQQSPMMIDSLQIHIEQLTDNYPLMLHAIIVAYDCCKTSFVY